MNSLISGSFKQVVLTDIWKLLPYPDFINLCKSNKTFLHILYNPNSWYYLLNRDYPNWQHPKITVPDPKEYYELSYWFGRRFPRSYLDTIGWRRSNGYRLAHPDPNNDEKYLDHANEFISNKCQQIISTQPNKSVTALLFLNWNTNSFKTILRGKNIYDLIFSAIKIISSEYSQSLIELFEDYFEFPDTSFQQICDHIITRWIKPNYEDSLPHITIISETD